MLHRATIEDAGVSRRYGEEIELRLDPLPRLSIHEPAVEYVWFPTFLRLPSPDCTL